MPNTYYVTYGNNVLTAGVAGSAISVTSAADPYNPLGLPPFTIRCKLSSGVTPAWGDSQTLVDATDNVWDITKNSTDWGFLADGNQTLQKVLGANTSSVTSMRYMFADCTNLTSVPLFDTSSVTSMNNMFLSCTSLTSVPLFDTSYVTDMESAFYGCYALTAIPLFDTSSVTSMRNTFRGCTRVEHGALALYQQASSQATPPAFHSYCFKSCGSGTTTGAAELAQIPSSWGGTGA